jgi:acetyl-CoA acyltransferase
MTPDRPDDIAIVDACRTPFTRAGGALADLGILDLATTVVGELVHRNDLAPGDVSSVILGTAMKYPEVAYLARETVIALGWPAIQGYDLEFACATSARTLVNGAHEILAGDADVVIAGGVESLSTVGARTSPDATRAVNEHRFKPEAERTRLLAELPMAALLPRPAQIAEPYTGKVLGEHAEEIVADWGISREAADALAVASHHRAAAARDAGKFEHQIIPVTTADGVVKEDAFIRADTSLEKSASLPPVFDPVAGTVTAANSSPLTDGGGAVLMASRAACERLGLTPRAWLRSWAFSGSDPSLGVLLGPAFTLPRALERAGLTLDDLDLVDLHEAFAGQVLANLAAMESDDFARTHLGRETAVGTVDRAKLNVNGGSIALGHPFGATGARLVGQVVDQLQARGARWGGIAICAGGTRGAAVILETAA